MKQKEETKGTLYFAYGSNMDTEQMRMRCPNSALCGTGLLRFYQFIVNARGYATIIPRHTSIVRGVLWKLRPEDERTLDYYEGCDVGLYVKCKRPVMVQGKIENALVYIDYRNTTLGTPQPLYMERIIAAAETHRLPEHYRHELGVGKDGKLLAAFNQIINEYKKPDQHIEQSWIDMVEAERDSIILDMLRHCTFNINALEYEMKRRMARRLEMYKREQEVHDAEVYPNRASFRNPMKASFDAVREEIRRGEYNNARVRGDLGTAGVIITCDPNRNHGPEDRVVVTEHAHAIEWLWRRIFFGGDCGISTSPQFIGLFADVAKKHCMENAPPGLLIDLVDSVELTVKTEQEREIL